MSKWERDFRKLIEEQNPEGKEEAKAVIRSRMAGTEENQSLRAGGVKVKKTDRKVIFYAIACAAIAVIAAALILVYFLTPAKTGEVSIPSAPAVEDAYKIYANKDDYTLSPAGRNLKQYSAGNGNSVLYFDWYDDTEELVDRVYKLNTTQEIICFEEKIMDMQTGYTVVLYASPGNVVIDVIENEKQNLSEKVTINATEVKFLNTSFVSKAYFEYGSFNYYIELEEPADGNAVIDMVTRLIPQ